MKTIHELLTDPDYLASLPLEELKKLLAPYIPAARTAALPQEKSSKIGMQARVFKDVIANFANDPKIAGQLAALREAREKKG